MSVVSFVKGLGNLINKNELTDDIAVTRQSVVDYAVPAYQSVQNQNLFGEKTKLLSAWNVKRQSDWARTVKVNIRGNMFLQTSVLLTKVPAILDWISREVPSNAEIHTDGLDYRTAAVLQVYAAMKFYVSYSTKLLLLSTAYEASVRANSKDLPYVKAEILQIEEQFSGFMQVTNFLAKHHTDLDRLIKAIPQVSVDITGENGLDSAYGPGRLDPLKQNLVATGGWNLIYTFRAWLANGQKQRFDALKVERQNLELRLLQLKQQQEGSQDAALEKTIQYHEKRLLDLNEQIRKEEEKYA